MRIQVGRCLCADSRTQSVDRVLGDHGVDRPDVHFVGLVMG